MSLSVRVRKRLGSFHLDAAFEGPDAGITCLYGPSGAGKSSLLAAVAGGLRPDAGRIAAGETVLFDHAARVDLPMERRAVGWVFQDARLFPHLSVEQNLRYGLERAKDRPRSAEYDEVLSVLGIGHLVGRRPRDLSGGERQRVGMGRALLSQPRLLVMDEPLASLDAARKAEILPFLERLKASFRLPVLYVTHSFSEVVRLADRLVVLDEGRVVAEGALSEVLARTDVPLLAGRSDAAAAVDGTIAAHEIERGLTRIEGCGITLLVPLLQRPAGSAVRAVVLARDVLLAGEEPKALSARNVLRGRVERIEDRADGSVLVRVALAEARLLSAVTRDAVESLGLAPGRPVWAVVKSVAVEGARGGGLLASLDD